MKLGSVPKLDKRNKTTSRKLTITSCLKIVTSLPFLQLRSIQSNELTVIGKMNPPITSKWTPKKPTLIRVNHFTTESKFLLKLLIWWCRTEWMFHEIFKIPNEIAWWNIICVKGRGKESDKSWHQGLDYHYLKNC